MITTGILLKIPEEEEKKGDVLLLLTGKCQMPTDRNTIFEFLQIQSTLFFLRDCF